MTSNILILDNVRSTYNVGSIIRSAAFFGIQEIWLCGRTPRLVDRFGRENERLAKVSLGGEKEVVVKNFISTEEGVKEALQNNLLIIGIEQDSRAISLKDFKEHSLELSRDKNGAAYILGEETKGVPQEILDMCDAIVEIAGHGNKESLNVSVAGGILMYEISGL